jgi:hypothetical protein
MNTATIAPLFLGPEMGARDKPDKYPAPYNTIVCFKFRGKFASRGCKSVIQR